MYINCRKSDWRIRKLSESSNPRTMKELLLGFILHVNSIVHCI